MRRSREERGCEVSRGDGASELHAREGYHQQRGRACRGGRGPVRTEPTQQVREDWSPCLLEALWWEMKCGTWCDTVHGRLGACHPPPVVGKLKAHGGFPAQLSL